MSEDLNISKKQRSRGGKFTIYRKETSCSTLGGVRSTSTAMIGLMSAPIPANPNVNVSSWSRDAGDPSTTSAEKHFLQKPPPAHPTTTLKYGSQPLSQEVLFHDDMLLFEDDTLERSVWDKLLISLPSRKAGGAGTFAMSNTALSHFEGSENKENFDKVCYKSPPTPPRIINRSSAATRSRSRSRPTHNLPTTRTAEVKPQLAPSKSSDSGEGLKDLHLSGIAKSAQNESHFKPKQQSTPGRPAATSQFHSLWNSGAGAPQDAWIDVNEGMQRARPVAAITPIRSTTTPGKTAVGVVVAQRRRRALPQENVFPSDEDDFVMPPPRVFSKYRKSPPATSFPRRSISPDLAAPRSSTSSYASQSSPAISIPNKKRRARNSFIEMEAVVIGDSQSSGNEVEELEDMDTYDSSFVDNDECPVSGSQYVRYIRSVKDVSADPVRIVGRTRGILEDTAEEADPSEMDRTYKKDSFCVADDFIEYTLVGDFTIAMNKAREKLWCESPGSSNRRITRAQAKSRLLVGQLLQKPAEPKISKSKRTRRIISHDSMDKE